MTVKKIEGLIAAAFTPFRQDGSVNKEMIPVLVDKLVRDGVTGIFICGSNGEGPDMTIKERMMVAEEFIKAGNKRLLMIVHVGHPCISDAKQLAEHAAAIGADAFSSVAAFYFKPVSVENLAYCMAEIAAGAPSIPFYYYHIPRITGITLDMTEFLATAGPLIPNLAGIKYTAPTLNEFQTCLNYENGKYDMLYGSDELLLPALAIGARGAIGSTYTFLAPIYLKIIEQFKEGNMEEAQKNQAYVNRVITEFCRYSTIPAQKAIMKMLGWDLGPCRLPLETISPKDYDSLFEALEGLSFRQYISCREQTGQVN